MNTREELHEILCDCLGSRHAYFQPPESIKMRYPAIVYSRSRLDTRHADNGAYFQKQAYQVTVIDSNPDSEVVPKVARLPFCRFDRHYVASNLNHDVFTIYC